MNEALEHHSSSPEKRGSPIERNLPMSRFTRSLLPRLAAVVTLAGISVGLWAGSAAAYTAPSTCYVCHASTLTMSNPNKNGVIPITGSYWKPNSTYTVDASAPYSNHNPVQTAVHTVTTSSDGSFSGSAFLGFVTCDESLEVHLAVQDSAGNVAWFRQILQSPPCGT